MTTGFVGTPYLCHVLSRYGYLDEVYMLLNRDEYPSWLYPVKQGATTIWERWDGQKPDGSFQDKSMNSFNHYAYGAIGEWMYRVMAGVEIDPVTPGYKHILIQPQPGGGFTRVKASHQTMYGKVSSAWTLQDGSFEFALEIPTNTQATVRLPGANLGQVKEGGKALSEGDGIQGSRQDGDSVVVEIGSGQYWFTYAMTSPVQPKAGETTASVSGNWRFVFNTEDGDREEMLPFQQDGSKVTGRWRDADIQGTFTGGQLDLSFAMTSQEVGMEGVVKIKGKLESGTLKGTWEFASYNGTFTATHQ